MNDKEIVLQVLYEIQERAEIKAHVARENMNKSMEKVEYLEKVIEIVKESD